MRMLLTRAKTMRKAVLLMHPKHSVHGMMTDTTKAPTLLYVNLRRSVEFNNTHPLSMEQNGISVAMRSSPVEGGAILVVWLCAILFFTQTCEIVDCIRVQHIQMLPVDLFAVSHQTIFATADSKTIRAITHS